MRSNYAACIAFTLLYEGGKVDNPKDPGGRTNQGVTQATYDAWRVKAGSPKRDVYLMETTERDAIYRMQYWDKVAGDTMSMGVDLATFDWGVNSGPARPNAALKALGATKTQLERDPVLVKQITDRRLSFLQGLSTFKTFGKGWTKRVAACEALGIKMASGPEDAPAVLQKNAAAAQAKAKTRAKAATGAAGGGLAAPAAITTGHASLAPMLILCALALIVAGLIAWKAFQHRARAEALSTLAKAS